MTMNEILEKYSDCDMFSLTGDIYNYSITEQEYLNALRKAKNKNKKEIKSFYDEHKSEFGNYPDFDKLYSEIEKECYEYNSEENKKKYLDEKFDKRIYFEYKKMHMSDRKIKKIRENFFRCSFIVDEIGKTTRYGKECPKLFIIFYSKISMLIDRENEMNSFCFNHGKNPIKQVPRSLRKYCSRYEILFFNEVTESSKLMINYYFSLNENTKKYLLKFKTDFDLKKLQDLAIYKNNKIKFYSCTHEGFNSLGKNR